MHYKALIDGHRIWNNRDEIVSIIDDLKKYREEIRSIELSSNSLGYDVAKALSEEIGLLEGLRRVNYRDIFVGRVKADLPKSLFELVSAIENHKHIEVLDLSDNAFGPIGVQSCDFFFKKAESLKELHIENNGLGPEGAEMLAEALLSNDNLKLEVLVINRNRLENKGAKAIAKVIMKMQSLKRIEMYTNGIFPEGMQYIIEALAYNPDLEVIRINDNTIKDVSETLIKVLPLLKNLRELDISDSLIGDEFSVRIFEVLASLPQIEKIYFNYNEVENKSAQQKIFEISSLIPTLKHLELKGNEINKKLYKQYNRILKNIEELVVYSDDEIDEEEEEDIIERLENVNINK